MVQGRTGLAVHGLIAAAAMVCGAATPVRAPKGNAVAVGDLLDRVLPGSRKHFDLEIATSCTGVQPSKPCFELADRDARVAIRATTASELAAAIGYYFREYCNFTIGWPRGGGSRLALPAAWPRIGSKADVHVRTVPWSYMMNVCTHSYSLVWYSWADWERFIDWMSLWGVNNVLALTGQEEIQYKVFRELGLNDTEIRGWFNGPGFLTWSRGQNEYGAGIAGMLPRSWMRSQWTLQRQILARYRELGIVGQLPGFQGNVPVGLKAVLKDANITASGATGWMDALDPAYRKVADLWMRQLLEDFGTDHWYQLDGYLNGGTAPWLSLKTFDGALAAGRSAHGQLLPEETPTDPNWFARGVAAFQGINGTDPDAIWSFQGFAFEFWDKPKQASWLKGFVSAVPEGRFSVVDMDYGFGQWQKFSSWWGNSTAFFGANFIWTALHNFGGTDGIKGNLSKVNEYPFAAQEAGSKIWGTGFTAEGIDQNPAYYEFVLGRPWAASRVANISAALQERAHRRYGLVVPTEAVSKAWELLASTMYSTDVGVQDDTGVGHLPGNALWDFLEDGRTPGKALCATFMAWKQLQYAASSMRVLEEPFRYDLVNLGRDVLARLSTPFSVALDAAMAVSSKQPPQAQRVEAAGKAYMELLGDLDKLVGTDQAFLLGSWLHMARAFGLNETDCIANGYPEVTTCEEFYEWNARVQLTTWNPTAAGAAAVPGGPIDYATKHWNGLIGGYYQERARRLIQAAMDAAQKQQQLSQSAVDLVKATWAHEWTTAFHLKYPTQPQGDPVTVSQELQGKYAPFFRTCAGKDTTTPLEASV